MMKQVAFAVACLALSWQALSAQDKPKEMKTPTREQCDVWVQQLANRQKSPFGSEAYTLNPHKNVDKKSLKDVKLAYDNLSRHYVVAIPSLIAGLKDKRYSYYQEVPHNGAFVDHSVGHACYRIIKFNVEVYGKHLNVLDDTGVPRSVHFMASQGGVEKWYATRKDKSLFEMQLEAVDWALAQKPDSRVDPKDWNEAMVELREFRETLAKSKQAYDPEHLLFFEGK